MKKALVLLVALIILFISVSPASAYKPKGCIFYKDPVGILKIDPVDRRIKAPYAECSDPVGNPYYIDVWLFITETTRITFADGGQATFDDLAVGQLIKYAFSADGRFHYSGDAVWITIYPD